MCASLDSSKMADFSRIECRSELPPTNAQRRESCQQRMKADGRWPKPIKRMALLTGEKLIIKRQKDAERQRRHRKKLREKNGTNNLSGYASQLELCVAAMGDGMVTVCEHKQDILINSDANTLRQDSSSSFTEYACKPELVPESNGAVLEKMDSELHNETSGASVSGQKHKTTTQMPVGETRLHAREASKASESRVSAGDVILYEDAQRHQQVLDLEAQQKLERKRWLAALRQRKRRLRLKAEGVYQVYRQQNSVFSCRNRSKQQEWEHTLPEDTRLMSVIAKRQDTKIRVARSRQRQRQNAITSERNSEESGQLMKDNQLQRNEGHGLQSTLSSTLKLQISSNGSMSHSPGTVLCSLPQSFRCHPEFRRCQMEVAPKLEITNCDDSTRSGQVRAPSRDDSCTIRIGLVTEFNQDPSPGCYDRTPCASDDSRIPSDLSEEIQTLQHHQPLIYKFIKTLQMDNHNLKAENVQLKKQTLCLEELKTDNALFHFLTGFASYETFKSLFELVQPSIGPVTVPHATVSPSLEEEFFYVLVRLRMGLFVKDIAARIGISEADYAVLFHRWITALLQQNVILETPHHQTVPDCIRVLVDCTNMVSEHTPTHLLATDQCKFVMGVRCTTGTVLYLEDASSYHDEVVTLSIGFSHLNTNIVDLKREKRNEMLACAQRDCLVGVVNRIRSFHILDNYQTKLECEMFKALFKVCALLSNAIK